MPNLRYTQRQVQRDTEPPPNGYIKTNVTIECEDCGEDCNPNELNNGVCESCIAEHYYNCDACSEQIHIDETYWGNDISYCSDCFYEYFDVCSSCDETIDRDYLNWSDSREEYFCDSCYEEGDCVENFEFNLRLPVNARKSTSFDKLNIKRFVGIEAECQYPTNVESLSNPIGWTHCYDGSISPDEDYSGTEMVSIPTNGDALYHTINNLKNWSSEYNASVNKSCGLHIHFNSLDLTAREVAFIGIVYKVLEPSIFNMMPPSRRKSNWCKKFPINTDDLKQIAKNNCEQSLVDYYYDGYSPSIEKYNDCRYYGLNLHARYYHGTIEFRHHSGTLNKTKILNWIKICNAIIEKGIHLSKEKTPTKLNKFMYRDSDSQRQLRYVLGSELLEYVNKRTAKFTTEGDNNE